MHENLTNEEASEKEKELIIKYDTRNKDKGYNIREGGSHGHLSEDTKRKLREGVGTKYDGEGNPFYGKKHTEEARQKMRESVRKR